MAKTFPLLSTVTFPKKQFEGLYCLSPFINVHIDHNGEVALCPCPGWGNTRIGNILIETLDSMLSSPIAQSIRQTIIDGTYTYCNEKICALITNNSLNTLDTVPPNVAWQLEDSSRYAMPYEIEFHGDVTCNLSCPSCRTHIIKVDDDKIAKQEAIGQLIYQNIFSKPTETYIHLITSGSGEVFASPMLMSFLSNLSVNNFPNLALSLHSNGLLAKKNWYRIEHLESNIKAVTISVDAACADTYEQVRRGGLWTNMLIALEFLQNKKRMLGFEFKTRMIVQAANYQEMIDFYHLCKSYDVDRIEYSKLNNWGTWSKTEFRNQNVFDPLHPDRAHALDLIAKIKTLPDVWFEGNFN
jgi:wyosine [tRNA(Phe)-imidazoG37] synthetase (radical SAM superfamily)